MGRLLLDLKAGAEHALYILARESNFLFVLRSGCSYVTIELPVSSPTPLDGDTIFG